MFDEETNAQLTGGTIHSSVLQIFEGWNLISGFSFSVNIDNIMDLENLIIPGTIYGFNESYDQVENIYPGKGYWLKSSGDGEIIIE